LTGEFNPRNSMLFVEWRQPGNDKDFIIHVPSRAVIEPAEGNRFDVMKAELGFGGKAAK